MNIFARRFKVFWGKFILSLEKTITDKAYLKYSAYLWLAHILLAFLTGLICGYTNYRFSALIDFTFIPVVSASVFFDYKAFFLLFPLVFFRHWAVYGFTVTPESAEGDFFYALGTGAIILAAVPAVRNYLKSVSYERNFRLDLDMARIAQRTLLSKPLEIGRIKITGYIHQCMQVGGDFYYFRPFMKKYIMIAIGDVMGKGITAAFITAIIMSVFYEWGKKTLSPSIIFAKVNQRLISIFKDCSYFSTLMYGIFNEETFEFSYAGAGHNGILIRNGGECELLEPCGIPIGMYPNSKWKDSKIILEPGSKIVLFTDGITEARDKNGNFYGVEKVIELAEKHHDSCADDLRDAILDDVAAFSDFETPLDDRAVVIMEIKY